jgi:hypothetical protein
VTYFFREALREQPGIGGSAWKSAWDRSTERWRHKLLAESTTPDDAEKQLKKDVKEWRTWLEPQRFHAAEGIPSEATQKLCQRVRQWAGASRVLKNTTTGAIFN